MMVDIRASDLLDRLDWKSPDFPAIARALQEISHLVMFENGQESFHVHVITVAGEESPAPENWSPLTKLSTSDLHEL